jgi:hypothetical protein
MVDNSAGLFAIKAIGRRTSLNKEIGKIAASLIFLTLVKILVGDYRQLMQMLSDD